MRIVDTAEVKLFTELSREERRELEKFRAKLGGYQMMLMLEEGSLIKVEDFLLNEEHIGATLSDGSKILALGCMDIVRVDNFYHLYKLSNSFGFSFAMNKKTIWDRPYIKDYEPEEVFFFVDEKNGCVFDVSEFFCDGDPTSLDFFKGEKDTIVFDPKTGEVGMFMQGRFYPIVGGNTVIHPLAKFILEERKSGQ